MRVAYRTIIENARDVVLHGRASIDEPALIAAIHTLQEDPPDPDRSKLTEGYGSARLVLELLAEELMNPDYYTRAASMWMTSAVILRAPGAGVLERWGIMKRASPDPDIPEGGKEHLRWLAFQRIVELVSNEKDLVDPVEIHRMAVAE